MCSQSFKTDAELKRYEDVMYAINENVALKHGGSLKAEHGTGRNVAPFVEMEWGTKAYELMWEVKWLFDPDLQVTSYKLHCNKPSYKLQVTSYKSQAKSYELPSCRSSGSSTPCLFSTRA